MTNGSGIEGMYNHYHVRGFFIAPWVMVDAPKF